jgi:hypothetical protein
MVLLFSSIYNLTFTEEGTKTVPLDIHTIESLDNSILSRTDRVLLLNLPQRPYAGGGAGVTVTAFTVSGQVLPPTYTVVLGDVGQAAVAFVTGRSFTGFTVKIAPLSSSASVAAGAIDVMIFA